MLIRNGKAAFIQQKANLVLAMMEGMQYQEQQLQLEPGDILYLYTDGVTEAAAPGNKMFGNDRLIGLLSHDYGKGDAACRAVCETVRQSISAFAENEPQSDDITQVCIYYAGYQSEQRTTIIESK